MSNLKTKILAAKDRKSDTMVISEWDVIVEVRGMSGATRAKFIETAYAGGAAGEGADEKANVKVLMPLVPEFVVDGVYDPATGEKVFTKEDIEAIQEKDGEILQRIAMKVIALSGLGAKAVEEAQGNSSATPNAAST